MSPIELAPESILFADDELVAVDKASGVLSDETRDPNREHLGTALRRWARATPDVQQVGDEFHPVHRLDRGTSGVVLFARNRAAATALMQQFRTRSVVKSYQAVVAMPPSARWTIGTTFERRSYLRHRKGNTEEVRSGGKPSESHFEVVDIDGSVALIGAQPKTGRTHQLRVHLAALGAPILGDDQYGPATTQHAHRLWLHASKLEIVHPRSDEPLQLCSRRALLLVDGAPCEGARSDPAI